MRLGKNQIDRPLGPRVSPSPPGAVLPEPALDLRGDAGIEGTVCAAQQVDVPHEECVPVNAAGDVGRRGAIP